MGTSRNGEDARNPQPSAADSKTYELQGQKMQRLADYLGHMHQPAVAHRFGEFAQELRAGVSPQRLNTICKSTLESITAHPDGLLVIYVQAPDGSADNVETKKYQALLKEIQSFARRHLRSSRLLWVFRGFRW